MHQHHYELTTLLIKKEMKELLLLYTKNVRFTFNEKIYIQVNGGSNGIPSSSFISRHVHDRFGKITYC